MWPPSLKSDVIKDHADYKAAEIEQYEQLYQGGSAVEPRTLLFQRDVDFVNPTLFQRRCEKALAIPHSSVLDYISATIVSDPPVIHGPEWATTLNKNADGQGHSLAELVYDLILSCMVWGRGYVQAAADMTMRIRKAPVVHDWTDELFRLDHAIPIRSEPWLQPDEVDSKLTFLTATEVVEYVLRHRIGQSPTGEYKLTSNQKHDFGRNPLFSVAWPDAGFVMRRIAPVLITLYNRESALTYSLDASAYALPVYKISDAGRKIVHDELCAIILQPGEEFGWSGPASDIHAPLFQDIERLRRELLQTLNALVMQESVKTQSPRSTAGAVAQMQQPLVAMLKVLAQPIKDTLQQYLDAVGKYKDSPGAKLLGMENYEIEQLQSFLNTPASAGNSERGEGNGRPGAGS